MKKKKQEPQKQNVSLGTGMTIFACDNGRKAIEVLCDAALKSGGLQAIQLVSRVISSVRPIPKPELPVKESEQESNLAEDKK